MAGKRARAPKKRVDYRKGGRVHAEQGFYADDITRMEQGGYSSPGNLPGSSYDINKVLTGSRYGATNNRAENTVFDNNVKPVGVQETFNPAAVEAGDTSTTTTTTTTPTYTAADVNQAYADLNAGKITAAQLASQYGVSEDYINTNLNAFNAKAAADKAAADKAAADKAAADKAAAAAAAKAPVLDIPADGDYTEAETQVVQDAIASGAISAAEVAAKFGVTEDQVTQEISRRKEVQAGEEVTVADPYAATPTDDFKIGADTPYEFRDMDAEADAEAAEAAAQAKTTAAVTDIPVDADYTQFEIDQVYDALQSGAMTVEQVAEQFGATAAQVQAEWDRMKQAKAGETVTGEDPFEEGVYEATKKALAEKTKKEKEAEKKARKEAQEKASKKRKEDLDTDTEEQLSDIDVATKTWVKDDPKTKNVDESQAAGAFLQDYTRVDPDLLFDKREAETLDIESGITPTAAVKTLDDYINIEAPDGVGDNEFTVAKANLTAAVQAGEVDPGDYEAYLINELNNNPEFASDREDRIDIDVSEIRKLTSKASAAKLNEELIQRGKAKRITDDFISDDSSVGQVDFRKAVDIATTPEAEAKTRKELTGTEATGTEAEIIKTAGYEAYKRNEVRGQAAKDAAVNFIAEVGKIQPNLARTIAENPAEVTAQIDTQEPEVKAAVRELPEEALVSTQMQTLMAGIETGEVPVWARPAFDLVNQNMTQRGLDASTVGRDALFNAIIQSALPIAQSNAQALQARASQNLSNEQQAEMARAQLDSTRRMNNLANRQTSESQTAQFAQNINVIQSQFNQERDTLSFQQQQQTRVLNLQNAQRTAELNKQAENAFKAQNLGNEQQIELANLEIKNQTEQQNMTAENQEQLAEMQIAADFISKNAAFDQQMKLANLSSDQQMRLANLTSRNQAASESLSNEQQTELANLNVKMQTNLASANIAQQMGVALLSADQQRAVENATMNARMDLSKFSDAQQVELANSRFMQTVSLTDFNSRQQAAMQDATALASLDMAAVDQRTKVAITQAQDFLQRDMANLSNEQQSLILKSQLEQQILLSDQAAANAAKQFNATSENQINQFNNSLAAQIGQFNTQQNMAMSQFNATETNRAQAINAGNAIDAAKFNNQIDMQVKTFNEQMDVQRDQWNAANAQAVEQSNVEWRRKANTLDTAAINAANQQNAMNAYNISTQDQAFIWQELRDEATYLRQAYENDEQRQTTLYATALANEGQEKSSKYSALIKLVDGLFDTD